MFVISHAPVWVWVLLAALLLRGIKALQPRTMSLARLLLLPVAFLVWGGYALCVETGMSCIALLLGVVGLGVGSVIGWWCWRATPALKATDEVGHVIRAGSALPLCFILVAFISRYIMTAYLHMHPAALDSSWRMAGVGLWSGVVDGVFWGGSFNLLWRYRNELRRQAGSMRERR